MSDQITSGIKGVLESFIKADDKAPFQRFIAKWTDYIEDDRDGYPEWGTACLKISKEIAPDPTWLIPWVEPKKKK